MLQWGIFNAFSKIKILGQDESSQEVMLTANM